MPKSPWLEVPKQFKAALHALRMKLTVGTGVILHEGLLLPQTNPYSVMNEADRDLLIHSVETGDRGAIHTLLTSYLGAGTSSGSQPRPHLQELVYPLCGLYTSLLHRLGRTLSEVLDEADMERFREPERFRSQDEMRLWWVARFERLSASNEEFRSDRKAKLVQSIEDYVEDNITENVTREQAARHVHINVSYLSRIFKEATGESFWDYVLRRKIEKAIRLLKEDDAMVYEVTDMLGYKDPSYFARIFKKYTGKSPSDFQK